MKADLCPHCGGDKALRNPSGFCDHLYYPENCAVCNKPNVDKKRLEAAAPDLLAAAKKAGHFIERMKAALIGVECLSGEYEQNIKPLFTAITQATGERKGDKECTHDGKPGGMCLKCGQKPGVK